jgi:hypothetical protein
MKNRIRLVGLVAAVGLLMGGDLLACGDKFLVAGRGTRYQRPKDARAAVILIYANPSSGLPAGVNKDRVAAVLKRQGHRSMIVETFEQLSGIVEGGRFDVILAGSGAAPAVERLVGTTPGAPVVLALDAPPKGASLLKAVDKAVEHRDQLIRQARASS